MKFIPVKTRAFLPPKDNIYNLLDDHLPPLHEGDILVITSKILGIHQGRCIKIQTDSREEKVRVALKEADYFVPEKNFLQSQYFLTIKDNTLIGASGVDRSNGNGYYVLWPKHNQKLLKEIWSYLKKKFKLKKLGVISIDSLVFPLRSGTVGISTGFYGFEPLIDYRGKKDIFGRPLKVTLANIVDSLAATSNLLMGESRERTPFLIIRDIKFAKFTSKNTYRKIIINPKVDVYYPLLKVYKKAKK